jgi:hypothetical protein
VNAGDLISHTFGLDDILQASEIVETRAGMKVVVEP